MENVNYLINRLITVRRAFLNSRLKSLGLSSSLFSFLVEITQHERLTQKELSRLLQVDPALTTRNIRKLIDLGYVVRVEDEDDRRYNYISLSTRGREISRDIIKLNYEWFELVSKDTPREELERALNTFKRIIINVETEILGESSIPVSPVDLPVSGRRENK